jgi:hypothetical protein
MALNHIIKSALDPNRLYKQLVQQLHFMLLTQSDANISQGTPWSENMAVRLPVMLSLTRQTVPVTAMKSAESDALLL